MKSSRLTSTTLKLATALYLALVVLSALLFRPGITLGIVVGGALTTANFWFLRWSLGRVLSKPGGGGLGPLLGLFVLKLAVLGAAFALIVRSGGMDAALGLFAGCSVIVIAVLVLAPILGVTGLTEEGEHGERY